MRVNAYFMNTRSLPSLPSDCSASARCTASAPMNSPVKRANLALRPRLGERRGADQVGVDEDLVARVEGVQQARPGWRTPRSGPRSASSPACPRAAQHLVVDELLAGRSLDVELGHGVERHALGAHRVDDRGQDLGRGRDVEDGRGVVLRHRVLGARQAQQAHAAERGPAPLRTCAASRRTCPRALRRWPGRPGSLLRSSSSPPSERGPIAAQLTLTAAAGCPSSRRRVPPLAPPR